MIRLDAIFNTQKSDEAQQILIAYHADCIDGFTSAWVTDTEMKRRGFETALLPMKYNEQSDFELLTTLSTTHFDRLYVVDFSLSISMLSELYDHNVAHPLVGTTEVFILDHHKTAFERYCPEVEVTPEAKWSGRIHGAQIVLDNDECGASLCWRVLCSPEQSTLIAYVKDYDLWRFKLGEETKWVNKYLCDLEKSLHNWNLVAKLLSYADGFAEVLNGGMYLQQEHDTEVASYTDQAEPVTLLGIKGLAVACPYQLTSDVGQYLAANSGTFGMMLQTNIAENKVKYSLRSENGSGFDVSNLAKVYGGGGHKCAAGFELQLIPDYVLASKKQEKRDE